MQVRPSFLDAWCSTVFTNVYIDYIYQIWGTNNVEKLLSNWLKILGFRKICLKILLRKITNTYLTTISYFVSLVIIYLFCDYRKKFQVEERLNTLLGQKNEGCIHSSKNMKGRFLCSVQLITTESEKLSHQCRWIETGNFQDWTVPFSIFSTEYSFRSFEKYAQIVLICSSSSFSMFTK